MSCAESCVRQMCQVRSCLLWHLHSVTHLRRVEAAACCYDGKVAVEAFALAEWQMDVGRGGLLA